MHWKPILTMKTNSTKRRMDEIKQIPNNKNSPNWILSYRFLREIYNDIGGRTKLTPCQDMESIEKAVLWLIKNGYCKKEGLHK